jgi:hypothetical protein
MLNELYALSRTLSSTGIDVPDWHRKYNDLPKVTDKAPCFRIWLTGHGKVKNIDEINADLALNLRKYGSKQGTFPAFNIVPLYRITDNAQIDALDSMLGNDTLLDLDKIKSLCVNNNWHKSLIQKIDNCILNWSDKLYKKIIEQNARDQSPVSELIECVKAFSASNAEGKVSFHSALECCAFDKLQKLENINMFLNILFHKGNQEKTPSEDCGQLSVILDLAEWEKYGKPVTNEQTTRWINNILLKCDKNDNPYSPTENTLDAYGSAYSDVNEPMPEVNIGFTVTLRTMFNAQHSQYRYRKIDDKSFPITKEHRADVKKALERIKQADNEGIMWQKADKEEIVFVYPSCLPEVSPKLAAVFAAPQSAGTQAEARFEQLAEDVIKTLQGILPQDTPDNIRVFAVRKMDKARSKVIFNRHYSAEWFIKSAEEWQKGCKNLPKLVLYASSQKKNNTKLIKKTDDEYFNPLIPFPLTAPRIINNVWKQDGKRAQGKALVKRMHYYQGIELLLDPDNEKVIRYYLHILLSHSTGLIQYMGDQQHRGRASPYNEAKEVYFVVTVLGLFLYKCRYIVEEYMESIAYLLGQTLKISDELHALYSEIVRKGDIPLQLAGNALFITAIEKPVQALIQLGKRMKPYIAWAKYYRTQKKTDSETAGDYLLLYEDTMSKVNSILVDKIHFDDFAKAQVFIGYLAALTKRKKTTG